MLCFHSPVSCPSLHMVPLAFLPVLNIASEMIFSVFSMMFAYFSEGYEELALFEVTAGLILYWIW